MKVSQMLFAALLLLTGHVTAFWRMQCPFETGLGRIDPLVDPGEISSHVHTFMGGGGIANFTANYDTLQAPGSCTSCLVSQDHSAYWTPALYFIYSNGTAVLVEQVGGMLAYYLPLMDNITAFQAGFQMIAGNLAIRNFTGPFPDTPLSFWPTNSTDDQFFLQQRAIGFNCLNYAAAPEPSLYRHFMPSKEYMDANCLDGLRLELAFPSCGNGSIDSSDHKSHMAYPSLVKEGNCPEGFPVHYPFLFYETIWATDAFASEDGQFTLSYGDPIGTGYHGDFIMGWQSTEFLQSALDQCTSLTGLIQDCPLFTLQSDEDSQSCLMEIPPAIEHDECHGPRPGLPVDIPIQYGPEQATTYPIAGRSGQATTTLQPTAAPSTFSDRPTLTYSPANPSSTRTAPGGIVVAIYSPEDSVETKTETAVVLSTSTVTPTPTLKAASTQPDIVATATITEGGDVVELSIAEVDVTVTSTTTATTVLGSKHKRHLHRHAHQHEHL